MKISFIRQFPITGRSLGMVVVLAPLLALFAYVALRAGPLAPVPVTVAKVEQFSVSPTLFGIGTVEARYTHKIGPTFAGRLKNVLVQPGERVKVGQLLAEIDPIDLDERIGAQQAALLGAESKVLAVQAQLEEVNSREAFARSQASRYEKLLNSRTVSDEAADVKRQEWQVVQASQRVAEANLDASRQDLLRLRAEYEGLLRQRANLQLVSPVDGLVSRRDADPGTTVVAGQTVVEVVEPESLWINARFDQQRAQGLVADLPASIVLRSRAATPLTGRVARIEPYADAVTEELLAKVDFLQVPDALPPIGELAEVTVELSALDARPVVANASVQRVEGTLGVWLVQDGQLRFTPIKLGASDLDGRIQVLEGLDGGEQVITYSRKALDADSRIKIVDMIVGQS
jgi:RND family efflux transporter MFP subunit